MIARSIIPRTMPPEAKVPRVLLIDEHAGASALLGVALEGFCAIHSCRGSDPIVDTLRIVAPDLVIVACNAPESAFELCGSIRAVDVGHNVPIMIATTSAIDENVVARALLCGADDVLVAGRPIELQARVRVQLRHKRDRDRLERVCAERDTYHVEAKLDALTGISNRRTFDSRLAEVHSHGEYALLFIDVDHFKAVNDSHGHDVGDDVLRALARCLYNNKRVGDTVARYGGEEFVVLLPDADRDVALAQAESHRRAIEALAIMPFRAGQVTVSVGVAIRSADEDSATTCRRADAALYVAKHAGRNCVSMASAIRASAPSDVERYLDNALASGRAGLPLLPDAAHEALRLAEDPDTDVAHIAKLVDRDPALAARFLALASSAAYCGQVKPNTTIRAIIRIGLLASRDLLLQAVYQRASDEMPFFGDAVAQSFERSVRSARAARLVAPFIAPGYDLAYLCGLLHDIGEARIYRILASFPEAQNARDEVDALVRKHHERAGAEIARAWRLPDDIVLACSAHHDASRTQVPIKIVRAADALVALAERDFDKVDARDPNITLLLRHVATYEAIHGLTRVLAEGDAPAMTEKSAVSA